MAVDQREMMVCSPGWQQLGVQDFAMPLFWRKTQVYSNVGEDQLHFTEGVILNYCLVVAEVKS
jgi:hypothetical protein